jgi:hypothetical protein
MLEKGQALTHIRDHLLKPLDCPLDLETVFRPTPEGIALVLQIRYNRRES